LQNLPSTSGTVEAACSPRLTAVVVVLGVDVVVLRVVEFGVIFVVELVDLAGTVVVVFPNLLIDLIVWNLDFKL
jgi:hypothetical protein